MHVLPHFRIKNTDASLREWKKIFHERPHKKYKRKTIIVGQGQSVTALYFIVHGIVAYISANEAGEEQIIDVLGKGNILGLQSFFGNIPTSGSFIALTDSTLSVISTRELTARYLNNNTLVRELLEEMADIACGLIRQLHGYTMSAGQRVTVLLCVLAEKEKKNSQVFLRISQNDLARIARTSRVTVTKTLRFLRHAGVINTAYGGITVRNVETMQGWVESPAFKNL